MFAITAVDPAGMAVPRAVDVEGATHHRAGAPAEQHPDGTAEDADQRSDHRSARHSDELGVVRALRDEQRALGSAFDDRGRLETDPAVGVARRQDAERLIRLARLGEADHNHILLSHF
jgi:hypothetical protein